MSSFGVYLLRLPPYLCTMPMKKDREISTNTLEWIGNGTIDDGKVFYR